MASDAKTDVTEMIRRTQDMVANVPAMAPQMEQFWEAQDGILDDVEDCTRAWFDRRHAATRSALAAVREVSGNGTDPATAMTLTRASTSSAAGRSKSAPCASAATACRTRSSPRTPPASRSWPTRSTT